MYVDHGCGHGCFLCDIGLFSHSKYPAEYDFGSQQAFLRCILLIRSSYFALAYAANDLVLIVLWVLASMEEIRYFSVVVCFTAFFVNDLYVFFELEKNGEAAECSGTRT